MATTLPTGELPSHLEIMGTPTRIDRSKHWVTQHRSLVAVLAVVVFVFWTLAAVEFGHWWAEKFPPLVPHLGEAFEHMAGLVLKWMW